MFRTKKLFTMATKPICSIKHFKRMLNSFRKIALKQINNNPNSSKSFSDCYAVLDEGAEEKSPLDYLCDKLLLRFKMNPLKTHSCFCKSVDWNYNKLWASYTVEDEDKRRIKDRNFTNKNLVFKVYVKIDVHGKRRIARWTVPITWQYIN